jgi:two-component system CheB/CheR fusion protein
MVVPDSSLASRPAPLPSSIEQQQLEAVLTAQEQVLEALAQDVSLAEMLDLFARTIERQSSDMLCSILLLDGNKLRHGAAPSLPDEYNRAVDGLMIGPDVGSCGTAAFTQQQVIVSDIAADPLWANYREIALKHDLHACWSAPIIAQDNVLGTFALYYRTPRRPSEHDQQLIGIWPKLVALGITRKRTEEALLKSEERFNLAVAGSNDGLWDWDVRTNEVYYAPRFKELLGYGDHEFENVFASFETHLHPADRERTLAKVHRHLDTGESYDVEYRLLTKCGEYRWFRARGQAVWDNAGRAVRMAGSLTDLMKQKQEEAVLERYTAEVQRANETLRIAEAEARKAVVKRDQFLAMLSHELRNPLSAIMSGIGVLDHTDADHEAVARARQTIRRQVYHMSRLLDDLLDIARITQGKIDFRKKVLDLNSLIFEGIQAVQPAMEARRQLLSVIPALGPVMVEGDPTRLLQIVENLLINASKYTTSEGAISLELKKVADDCVLCVRDNGRGIDPEMLVEIFDMFFQSNEAIDRSDGGMGVGLTLVRTLVEMHGGTVTAHSEGVGHGSQFEVRLPLASNPPTKSTEQHSVTAGVVNRVLVVEDNADSRNMLQTLLKLDGFQVEVAEDGQQGLDAILAQRPDVALIDIGLPELDGYEVARRVRKQLSRSEVRLVALTGYGQAKDREAVFQAGFDEHLVKPVNPQDLARVLSTPRKPR